MIVDDSQVREAIREMQVKQIDGQTDKGFGPNPVAIVKCPHCGGTMQAIDAKKHVRSAK